MGSQSPGPARAKITQVASRCKGGDAAFGVGATQLMPSGLASKYTYVDSYTLLARFFQQGTCNPQY